MMDLKPLTWGLQETQLQRPGKIKSMNSNDYQIYEVVRDRGYGGMALGVHKSLESVWLRQGSDRVEALTINVSVKGFSVQVTIAYGPQEYNKMERKEILELLV